MKKKFTRIFGVGMLVVLLAGLLVGGATPASADDNAWVEASHPGDALSTVVTKLLYSGADVSDVAVYGAGEEIWAVTGADNWTWKSTDGGHSWSYAPATQISDMTPDLIAVAPDNSDIVAIGDISTDIVYVTTDGGVRWSKISPVAVSGGSTLDTMTDIAIAPAYLGANNIAISGYDTGNLGNVFVFNVGASVPAWSELRTKAGFGGTGNDATTVGAVAFSPNFPSDLVMAAITANVSTTAADWVYWELYSFAHTAWNTSAGFPSGATGYPKSVATGNYTGVTAADISLDPEYLGSDDILRNGFAAVTVAGTDSADSAVYRVKDTAVATISAGNFYSVAYDGTNLVAGQTGSTSVYRCANPMDVTPLALPSSSLKSPGGTGNVTVKWAGEDVVAGSQGHNSAFAVSRNNGQTFNDIGLIDAAIGDANDVVLTDDASVIYYETDNGTGDSQQSLWRYASAWERVLCVDDDSDYIVRTAPEDPDVVYVAEKAGTTIYYTKDGGDEKWYTRTCSGVSAIADLAVESADVAYALASGGTTVSKTTNSGFTWALAVSTKMTGATGYSLLVPMEDHILVGGTVGKVCYSTDGNTSWTAISSATESGAGNVILAADADYANNNTFYAASDAGGKNIMKWVIGTSSVWEDIYYGTTAALATTDKVRGLTVQGGTLYALTCNGTAGDQSSLYQFIPPTSWDSAVTTTITETGTGADTTIELGAGAASPNILRGTTGSNKLWTLKTIGTQKIYSITDALIAAGPTLLAPVDGFSNGVNTISGTPNDIVFSWERLSNATEHTIEIAYDEAFTEDAITDVAKAWPSLNAIVGPGGSDSQPTWQLGTTYYWRVRASEPMNSPYSEVRTFTIQPGVASVPSIGAPANGGTLAAGAAAAFSWSPVSGTTMYEFQLASDTTFADPLVAVETGSTGIAPDVTLESGMTYFWRVRAIEPVEGDWSTIANFSVAAPVEAAPPTAAPPQEIVIEQEPITVEIPDIVVPETVVNIPPEPEPVPAISETLLWVVIIVGAILVIALIVLIVRTRRTV